jgi:hypothetical protein
MNNREQPSRSRVVRNCAFLAIFMFLFTSVQAQEKTVSGVLTLIEVSIGTGTFEIVL